MGAWWQLPVCTSPLPPSHPPPRRSSRTARGHGILPEGLPPVASPVWPSGAAPLPTHRGVESGRSTPQPPLGQPWRGFTRLRFPLQQ